jgi:hypothetical protein
MRRIAAGGLAIAVLLGAPLLAAGRAVTVRELAQILASAQASRLSDEDIAREIAPIELTERLTEATLTSLSTFFLYWQDFEKKEQRVAYRGAVFIEPNSGSIFRISWQAVDVPPAFPMHSSETVVDYRPVEIGGGSWLCPVRSVTISGSGKFVSLNRVEFTNYHKFGSEARIVGTDIR